MYAKYMMGAYHTLKHIGLLGVRPFTRLDFQDIVPNSGQLTKLSLFCPEFWLYGLNKHRFCADAAKQLGFWHKWKLDLFKVKKTETSWSV